MAKSDIELRQIVCDNLGEIVESINRALSGDDLAGLKDSLTRLGRGGRLPGWYEILDSTKALPSLNVKTIGSIVEMLLVAILETRILKAHISAPLSINPARGVDIPFLKLGVKSPSKNYCTSEPFFSAYERLIGNEHDAVILLTDYQEAQKDPPLRLKITKARYMYGSQMADENLCRLAKSKRAFFAETDPALAQRFFQFLAYINQSDWLGKRLITLLGYLGDEVGLEKAINAAVTIFDADNKKRDKGGKILIPPEHRDAILRIKEVNPMSSALLTACDNWTTNNIADFARAPSGPQFERLMTGNLDGQITMSFALQWRYNFARVFDAEPVPEDEQSGE